MFNDCLHPGEMISKAGKWLSDRSSWALNNMMQCLSTNEATRNQCMMGFAGSMIPGEGAAEGALAKYLPEGEGFLGEAEQKILGPGTIVDRYGQEGSPFVSPQGVPIEMRSLPPSANTNMYNSYQVLQPMEVRAGTIAPAFGHIGLGTQYVLPDSVSNLVNNGFLSRM